MKPYNDWLETARRFDKAVDFGSPMSAWTDAMWVEYKNARAEHRQPDMRNVVKPAGFKAT